MFDRATITLGIDPHSSFLLFFLHISVCLLINPFFFAFVVHSLFDFFMFICIFISVSTSSFAAMCGSVRSPNAPSVWHYTESQLSG